MRWWVEGRVEGLLPPQQRQCAGQRFFLIITIKADKRAAKVEFPPSSGAERGSVWGSHSNSRISPVGGEGDYSASQLGAVCMSAPLSWWLLRRGSTQLPSPRDGRGKILRCSDIYRYLRYTWKSARACIGRIICDLHKQGWSWLGGEFFT